MGLAVQISLGKTNLGWQPAVSAFSTSRHFRSIFMLINMTSSLSTSFIYQHNRHVVSINTSTLFFCRPLCCNLKCLFFLFVCLSCSELHGRKCSPHGRSMSLHKMQYRGDCCFFCGCRCLPVFLDRPEKIPPPPLKKKKCCALPHAAATTSCD